MNEKLFGTAADVFEAARTRRSVRAYKPDPVPAAVLREIVELGGQAPSGSNIQPWRVHVLTGATLKRLGDAIQHAFLSDEPGHVRDYDYYTDPIEEPYLARRRACGWGLYSTLGIGRGDREKSKAYRARNYNFFGAPAGFVFTIDRTLERGSWLDYGMFLQTIMLAARARGLHTCAEAAIASFVSSLANAPLPADAVYFGEVSLSGAVRPVAQSAARLKEAAKLGFTRAITPEAARDNGGEGLKLTDVRALSSLVADIAALGMQEKLAPAS